jgi:hypothetical protein
MTALTNIVDHNLKEIEQDNYTVVSFLAFKEALDIVNRNILLSKLSIYKLDDLSFKLV